MTQSKLTLRPPPHVDFIRGYPGIPAGPDRPAAHIAGTIEVRLGARGYKATWLRIELRKLESLPGNGGETFGELIGNGPINVWEAAHGGWEVLSTADFPFKIMIPEGLPPMAKVDRNCGIQYELVASLCVKSKKGLLRKEATPVLQTTHTLELFKHELHSAWPLYHFPEERENSVEDVTVKLLRSSNCAGPGDQISVRVIVRSDRISPIKLKAIAISLKQTITFRGGTSTSSCKKAAAQRSDEVVTKNRSMNEKLYKGDVKAYDITCTVPDGHQLTSIRTAKHLDVSYHLRVRAGMDGTQDIILDHIPMTITNFSKETSAAMVERIGYVASLCPQLYTPPQAPSSSSSSNEQRVLSRAQSKGSISSSAASPAGVTKVVTPGMAGIGLSHGLQSLHPECGGASNPSFFFNKRENSRPPSAVLTNPPSPADSQEAAVARKALQHHGIRGQSYSQPYLAGEGAMTAEAEKVQLYERARAQAERLQSKAAEAVAGRIGAAEYVQSPPPPPLHTDVDRRASMIAIPSASNSSRGSSPLQKSPVNDSSASLRPPEGSTSSLSNGTAMSSPRLSYISAAEEKQRLYMLTKAQARTVQAEHRKSVLANLQPPTVDSTASTGVVPNRLSGSHVSHSSASATPSRAPDSTHPASLGRSGTSAAPSAADEKLQLQRYLEAKEEAQGYARVEGGQPYQTVPIPSYQMEVGWTSSTSGENLAPAVSSSLPLEQSPLPGHQQSVKPKSIDPARSQPSISAESEKEQLRRYYAAREQTSEYQRGLSSPTGSESRLFSAGDVTPTFGMNVASASSSSKDQSASALEQEQMRRSYVAQEAVRQNQPVSSDSSGSAPTKHARDPGAPALANERRLSSASTKRTLPTPGPSISSTPVAASPTSFPSAATEKEQMARYYAAINQVEAFHRGESSSRDHNSRQAMSRDLSAGSIMSTLTERASFSASSPMTPLPTTYESMQAGMGAGDGNSNMSSPVLFPRDPAVSAGKRRAVRSDSQSSLNSAPMSFGLARGGVAAGSGGGGGGSGGPIKDPWRPSAYEWAEQDPMEEEEEELREELPSGPAPPRPPKISL